VTGNENVIVNEEEPGTGTSTGMGMVEGKEKLVMNFHVTIDRDEDGMWIVECPAIPGCVSQGKTKEEALNNIKDAIQSCLEVRGERGLPMTIETRQVAVTV